MKIAILIDGGYFLKRLPALRNNIDTANPKHVCQAIGQLVNNHLEYQNKTACAAKHFNLLYRCFYYDATPYMMQGHKPVSKQAINYAKSDEAVFRLKLFELLRKSPNFAVRLGEVRKERSWIIKEQVQKDLLAGRRDIASLTDDDFQPGLRQKAVDMRLGIDIASITLKKQADTLILVTGDSDFVPAAKLARREGVRVILDPLWRSVHPQLYEHIDGLRSGFPRPGNNPDSTAGENRENE